MTKKQKKKAKAKAELGKKLVGYSAAAKLARVGGIAGAAAALSVPLFVAEPAEAGLVFNSGNITTGALPFVVSAAYGTIQTVTLDLDNAYGNDFVFYALNGVGNPGTTTFLVQVGSFFTTPGNVSQRILTTVGTGAFPFINVRSSGQSATANENTLAYAKLRSEFYLNSAQTAPQSAAGNWENQSGFVAVKFFRGANTHLGFMELSVSGVGKGQPNTITLLNYAYNDVPIGQAGGDSVQFSSSAPPPVIPEPGTLLTLALGAAGLYGWRLRRQKQAENAKKAAENAQKEG